MDKNINEIMEKIRAFLKENGAGDCGFFRCEEENPFGLKFGISFVMPLSSAIVDTITDEPTHTYFHHYRTMNAHIDRTALNAGFILRDAGYNYVPVPASQSVGGTFGIFSHKYGAVLSGLGTIGKSALFVSDKFGPRVRIGTVLTDCPFECENNIRECLCGECRICASACPAQAISGRKWEPGADRAEIIDAAACSSFMKKKFQHIGRDAVCGICMKVCPKGKLAK